MNKTTLFLKLGILLVLPLTFLFFSGCASTQTEKDSDWEPWVGELSGMVDADLNMFFSRLEEAEGIYLVKGTFKGDIESVAGGYGSGTMTARIKGRVKDGIFDLSMWGFASVSEGRANIDGKMIGTLSKTQAFGSWTINALDDERTYKFSGDWSAKKVDNTSQ